MKKIFFVVNKIEEFQSEKYLKKYLKNVNYKKGTNLPKNSSEYDLIILWNYRKILKNIENHDNVILFHSSDLPKGKGWATIYNAIYKKNKDYVISGIFAANKVDSGDIIIQAKFKIKPNYTAEYLREWDNEISIMMIKKILNKFKDKKIIGIKQKGKNTYYKRRRPEDNELEGKNIINHLRACEKQHPAFFYYKKEKYYVTIQPEKIPTFPTDLKIIFPK